MCRAMEGLALLRLCMLLGRKGSNTRVDTALRMTFTPSSQCFVHNGRTWLKTARGYGTRRRASAQVLIREGTGRIFVSNAAENKHSIPLDSYWDRMYHRMDVVEPFAVTGAAGKFDVFVGLHGGGKNGQAVATRLAVGRALLSACPNCLSELEEEFILEENTMQKLPPQFGRVRGRKAYQWRRR